MLDLEDLSEGLLVRNTLVMKGMKKLYEDALLEQEDSATLKECKMLLEKRK
jgi:hypothetical protein